MIKAIINGVMKLVISLVSLLLAPIDALIEQFLPDVGNMLDLVNNFFNYISNFISWAISWTALNDTTRGIIVAYFTFILTVPLLISTIKLALKWYDKLKL